MITLESVCTAWACRNNKPRKTEVIMNALFIVCLFLWLLYVFTWAKLHKSVFMAKKKAFFFSTIFNTCHLITRDKLLYLIWIRYIFNSHEKVQYILPMCRIHI